MTSNIGSHHLLEGVRPDGELTDAARDAVMRELRGHFRPEFLNRVDDLVLFKPLTLAEIERIVDLQMADLRRRLAERKISIELTEPAREFVARQGFDPVFGARPLKRFLQHQVESRVGRAIIAGDVGEGSRLVVDVREGELVVDTDEARVPAAEVEA
jgi:ATP-dependent Clp protease ATP-binding subunit ClpB